MAKKKPEILAFIEDAVVHSGDDCLRWPFAVNNMGYAQMYLEGRKKTLVSRIVCGRIHGPPFAEAEAAHSCGRGHLGCVSGAHLSWKTRQENSDEANYPKGEDRWNAKLTEDQVREIKTSPLGYRLLGQKFGVRPEAIRNIRRRGAWAHVS